VTHQEVQKFSVTQLVSFKFFYLKTLDFVLFGWRRWFFFSITVSNPPNMIGNQLLNDRIFLLLADLRGSCVRQDPAKEDIHSSVDVIVNASLLIGNIGLVNKPADGYP
jgi:hypothetical protein